MKDKITMDLKELDNGEVEIAYRMDVNMVGKLAMFGDRVMRSKATEVEKEFVKNLQAKLRTVA
jgi:carbon monoxide dehydrogenase subunit G